MNKVSNETWKKMLDGQKFNHHLLTAKRIFPINDLHHLRTTVYGSERNSLPIKSKIGFYKQDRILVYRKGWL